jgi:hypothetical protein
VTEHAKFTVVGQPSFWFSLSEKSLKSVWFTAAWYSR